MDAIKGALGGHECASAVCTTSQGRERAGFHREQPRAEGWVVSTTAKNCAPGLGQAQAVAGTVELLHEVAHARVHVRGQFDVVGRRGETQRALEMLVCASVVAGVVSHPAGHLGEGGRGAEEVGRALEQERSDLLL